MLHKEGEGGLVSTSCDGVHGMHRVIGEQGEFQCNYN